jgi:membrane-associated protease RseP (regulator of RpoE activity)
VTALNLIPVGQLDGGHIAYAIFGKNHRILARVSFMLLVFLGFMWFGWWTWAFLLFILGIDHPSPLNEVATLDRKRKILGGVALLLFILTFMPAPFLPAS